MEVYRRYHRLTMRLPFSPLLKVVSLLISRVFVATTFIFKVNSRVKILIYIYDTSADNT